MEIFQTAATAILCGAIVGVLVGWVISKVWR